MHIQYNIPAGEGEVYARDCFDGHIGKFQTVKIGRIETEAEIVAVKVAADGRSVLWTVDIPEAPGILANPN
jgi:hypothetical protein